MPPSMRAGRPQPRATKGQHLDEDTTTDIDTTLPIHPRRLTQPPIDAARRAAALVYAGGPERQSTFAMRWPPAVSKPH